MSQKSPLSIIDDTDPGDDTQLRFRYQHAYGVILLAASARGDKPYKAIWCEHHEDLLCERLDGLFDAYQIKTQKPESGYWDMKSDALKKSIKKFTELVKKFPSFINELVFVSNTEFFCPGLEIKDQKNLSKSPIRFLEAINDASSYTDIAQPFNQQFIDLKSFCGCSEYELFLTLKKVKLVKGPEYKSFDSEISHDHIGILDKCKDLNRARLNAIRDELIAKIYSASSLSISHPNRHLYYLNGLASTNPMLISKRVGLEIVDECIQTHSTNVFRYLPSDDVMNIQNKGLTNKLIQKFTRGCLANQLRTMQRRKVSTEEYLISYSYQNPTEIEQFITQLEGVVQAECDVAYLKASCNPEPFGPTMLLDVHNKLESIVQNRPEMIYSEPIERLMGIVGILTEECKVWWSAPFDLEEAA